MGRPKSRRRRRIARLWPSVRLRRKAWRAFRDAPTPAQALIVLATAVLLWFAFNWMFQVIRKPSELFFPVSNTLNKIPSETWRQYAPLFRKYSTRIM